MTKSVRRLYQQFKPNHYALSLTIDAANMTFEGSVTITGEKCGRPTQRLTLHQKNLKITGASLLKNGPKGDKAVVIDRINHHKSYDEVRLHTSERVVAGNYTLVVQFSGTITKQMNGMYPCFFEDDGQQKKLIATQFESHHAREVFPCIDEPEAKATFTLTLQTQTGINVLSNTPVAKQTEKSGSLITTFEKTPHMSTYLLAFVIGEMKYLEQKTKQGVTVRTYATPTNAKLTTFALDTAVRCLEFFDEYFGIAYPLKKCDLIALPDFASGAMENWGCITFREQTMLVDPKNSSLHNKQYVALVVAHELAHQWFGNLVTMRWWTDLWLNEGFASWIEYLAVDYLYPKWQLWSQFIVDEQQSALKLDALEHTHPVEVPVGHPDEIRTIFDAISYNKGASIIHMLQQYLGADVFRDGLRHYLTKHAYNNTDTVDLWASLESVSSLPVRDFMHAWTSQSGFPLIKAEVSDASVILSQQRFYTNPEHSTIAAQYWPVPLLSEQADLPQTLPIASKEYETSVGADFKLNEAQSGFYRVLYNDSHLQRLGSAIQKGQLSDTNRLGILSDVIESAKAGYTSSVVALKFLQYFAVESDYPIWDIISASLGSLRHVMNDESLREVMKPFVLQLIQQQSKRLGWEQASGESHFDQLLRPIILGMSATADDSATVAQCQKLFAQIAIEKSSKKPPTITINPDLRGVVYGTVARLGGQPEFEKLLGLHTDAVLSEEQTTLIAALTNFQQPALIKRALNLINSDAVRLQDVSYWLAYSFMNRHAKQATWEWVKHNWKWLQEQLGNDLSFYRMPIYAARAFSDESFIEDYAAFFEPKMSPALDRSYKQGLEMLQWQTAWKQRDLRLVKKFFKEI